METMREYDRENAGNPPPPEFTHPIHSRKQHRKTSSPKINHSINAINFSAKNLSSCESNRGLNMTSPNRENKSLAPLTPSMKNVGVGANLTVGRHSSPSVAVGHGHLGSIDGPATVSISAGTNKTPKTNANSTLSPVGGDPATAMNLVSKGNRGASPTSTPPMPPEMSQVQGSNSSSGGDNVNPTIKKIGLGAHNKMVNGRKNEVTPTPAPAAAVMKIGSQNFNGTPALTGIPRTDSEVQLFRVLQRANLLLYFDVMIELGGDDVQQLCEAGREEFLEIMALIGMASKPLHVRRLQKALQEWMSNPTVFQTPVLPPGMPLAIEGRSTSDPTSSSPLALLPPSTTSITATTRTSPQPPAMPIRPIPYHSAHTVSAAAAMAAVAAAAQQAMFFNSGNNDKHKLHVSTSVNGHHHNSNSNSPNNGSNGRSHLSLSPNPIVQSQMNHSFSNGYHHHPPKNHQHHHSEKEVRIPVDQIIPSHFLEQRIRTASEPNSPAASEGQSDSGSSHSPVPFLQEAELTKVIEAAAQIVKKLPGYVFEPQVPSKRKFSGDFEMIMRLSPNDPRRIDEIRKMSTVYGRPDPNCSTHPNKRKYPKPLTMHEVCVNEGAAQLCKLVPSLLTYRDELCALAKQVVRDAELPYSSNHNHTYSYAINNNNNNSNYFNQNETMGQRRGSGIELNEAIGQRRGSGIDLEAFGLSQRRGSGIDLNDTLGQRRGSGIDLGYLSAGGLMNGNGLANNGTTPGDHSGAKRIRLEGANGIEIQEYSRPSSNHSEASADNNQENSMQITPIRNLPRRSPSDDHHSPLPLELVAVASNSPSRCSGSGSPGSKSTDSAENTQTASYKALNGSGSNNSLKITSIPVDGGFFNISHDPNISGSASSSIKLLPIKSEPAN